MQEYQCTFCEWLYKRIFLVHVYMYEAKVFKVHLHAKRELKILFIIKLYEHNLKK